MSGRDGKRHTALPRFNPLVKDDRLLPGYCFSQREHKPKKKEAPKEELISTDAEHVLSMEADTRKEWYQMALMQAATGSLKSSSLYDVIVLPSFASTKDLKKMVEANMHFFSPKQQKELKKVLKTSVVSEDAKAQSNGDEGADKGSSAKDGGDASRGGASRSPSPRKRRSRSASRSRSRGAKKRDRRKDNGTSRDEGADKSSRREKKSRNDSRDRGGGRSRSRSRERRTRDGREGGSGGARRRKDSRDGSQERPRRSSA